MTEMKPEDELRLKAVRFQAFLNEHDWEMTVEEAEEMLKLIAKFEEQEAEA